jgi:S1-C subfamily serine protease
MIVTTQAELLSQGVMSDQYSVTIGDARYIAKPVSTKNVPKVLTFLKISDLPDKGTVDAVSFGTNMNPRIGQTVVVLGGEMGAGVFKTTLSRFVYESGDGTSTAKILSGIEVTPRIPDGYSGGLVANLDGLIVGMSVWNEDAKRFIILPADRIYDAMQAPQTTPGQAVLPSTPDGQSS